MPNEETVRDLGHGLVLRGSTIQDTTDLVAFDCKNHPPLGFLFPQKPSHVWKV